MRLLRLYRDFFYHIYYYREYLKQSVARDLRKKYKRSVLGYLWSMLNPLLMMTILAVVFSKIMRAQIDNYAVFLFTAMIPWQYFDSTSLGCLGTIRSNARIIDQVAVPKYIFPLSIAFSNLANFFLALVPLFVVMLVLGRDVPITVLALPIVLLPLFLATMGVALVFSVANVFFEDTQHLATVMMRALFYLSPILYSRENLPEWLVKWVVLNPMFTTCEFMRDLFYFGTLPDINTYLINVAGSTLLLGFGLWVFKKADDKFLYFI